MSGDFHSGRSNYSICEKAALFALFSNIIFSFKINTKHDVDAVSNTCAFPAMTSQNYYDN